MKCFLLPQMEYLHLGPLCQPVELQSHMQQAQTEPFRVAWLASDTSASFNYLAQNAADVSITYHAVAELVAMQQAIADRCEYAWRDHWMLIGRFSFSFSTKAFASLSAESCERTEEQPSKASNRRQAIYLRPFRPDLPRRHRHRVQQRACPISFPVRQVSRKYRRIAHLGDDWPDPVGTSLFALVPPIRRLSLPSATGSKQTRRVRNYGSRDMVCDRVRSPRRNGCVCKFQKSCPNRRPLLS